MKRGDIRVGIVYIEGTNCEEESVAFFRHLGAQAEKVHLKQLTGDVPPTMKRTLDDFDLLMIPPAITFGPGPSSPPDFGAGCRRSSRNSSRPENPSSACAMGSRSSSRRASYPPWAGR